MSWLKRLTDRLVLKPSTDPVDAGSQTRQMIPCGREQIEAWTTRVEAENTDNDEQKVVVLKFIGNAGRAENSTTQPASLWKNTHSEIWTINPFGYGGSTGVATLQRFPDMVDAVYQHIRDQFPDYKLVVFGNSIGSISALCLAAKYRVDGLCIRNPVPIHQLISQRAKYAIPSLGLSSLIARQIPQTLNAVQNAKQINSPALFVTLADDRMIPPHFQAKIIDAFSGEKKIFSVPGDHNDPIPEPLHDQYRKAANWLLDSVKAT